MAKNINIKLAVKDQFTAPLKRASKSTRAMDMQLKRTQRTLQKFANTAKRSMTKVAKAAGLMAGAGAAAAGVFLKNSVDAAKVQIEQETKLQAVLMNTKGMRAEQIEGLKKYAGELQNVGVIGDEVALAGVQQLGSYQLQASTLKKLMPGMNDLLVQQKGLNAATGDAVNIGNMIGKVMTGQVGALSRAGINFTKAQERVLKFGKEQEKAAVLAKVLQQNVGGTNKAMAATDQGRIQQAVNAYGDMQEVVGTLVLPYLGKVAAWFKGKIPVIQNYMIKLEATIAKVFETVKPYFLTGRDMLGSIADDAMPALKAFGKVAVKASKIVLDVAQKIVKNWDRIAPAVYTVVGAMTAYKLIAIASASYTYAMITAQKLKASWDAFGAGKLTILTAAQWAYNAAMNANPIGLVITAIGALVGVGVTLYKNWDIVTAKCKQLWNHVTDLWESLDNNPIGKFGKRLLTLLSPIHQVLRGFKLLKGAWGGVKNLWNKFTGGKDPKAGPTDPNAKPPKTDPNGKQPKTNPEDNPQPKPKMPPRHSLGTEYFQGGPTRINEGGRSEMAVLPSGSKIISHEATKAAATAGPNISVNLSIQGNVLGNESFMEECGQFISKKILEAIQNI